MKKFLAIFLSVGLLFTSTNAFAITPDDIKTAMDSKGYTVVNVSENTVAVMYRGLAVMIAVDGRDGDVTYLAYLDDISSDMLSYDFLNRYNNDVKFGRAFLDRQGDLAIQMDRNSSGGVTLQNVESDFMVFISLVRKFVNDVQSQVAA
ncbi:MAG: YbjN domain-containing protein [Aquisalinus sp.]|nr:YbjN domain-containing protein [Aquisalinus sp.]